MSSASVKILRCFLEHPSEPQYGFGLMRATGVKAGSLYPILDRLEHAQWLESTEEDIDERAEGRPRRRLYRLTAKGAPAAVEAIASFYDDLGIPATLVPRLGSC